MRVSIIINDEKFSSRDFTDVLSGNPGIGGTQYLMILLAFLLSYKKNYSVYLFHYSENKYPNNVISIKIKHFNEVLDFSTKNQIDKIIFGPGTINLNYKLIHDSNARFFYWAHNFINWEELIKIKKLNNLQIIFVGKEQCDKYLDSEIIFKSRIISNVIANVSPAENINDSINNYLFMGSLIKYKGFHVLAKIWDDVLKLNPSANLHIIGSSSIYDDGLNDGDKTPASKDYEEQFLKFISKDGKIYSNVHFYGMLGLEKNDIIKRCNFGIFNPLCKEETFGLTILEMQQNGLIVIAGKSSGTVELIRHKYNGLIFNSKRQLIKNIKIVNKKSINLETMSKNSVITSNQYTNFELFIEAWDQFLKEPPNKNVGNIKIYGTTKVIKYLKLFNIKSGLYKFLSISEFILFVKHIMKKIFKR